MTSAPKTCNRLFVLARPAELGLSMATSAILQSSSRMSVWKFTPNGMESTGWCCAALRIPDIHLTLCCISLHLI